MRKSLLGLLAMLVTFGAVQAAESPAQAAKSTVSHVKGLPPYWHGTAPKWCLEDMPCWIGSAADGRSDKASIHDWSHQLKIGQDDLQTVWVYLPHQSEPMEVGKGGISHVHNCKRYMCEAWLAGYNDHTVLVTRSDFGR